MPDMGRGITAPEGGANIKTGATEMQTLGSTAATAIDDLEAAVDTQLANRSLLGHKHTVSDITDLASLLSGKMNVEATELASGTDANTLIVPGVYYESTSAQAGPNFPEATAGVFQVTANESRQHVQQTFVSFGSANPRQWYRSRYNGTWSTWKQLVTEERLAEVMAGYSGFDATELGETHLDDVVSPGVYWQRFGAYATLDLGYPVARAGHIIVTASADGVQVTQQYVSFDTTVAPMQYVRNFYNGTWGAWYELGTGGGSTPDPSGDAVYKGNITDDTDVNLIREPGIYSVSTAAVAGTLVNWPTIRPGILTVWTNAGTSLTTQEVVARVSNTDPTETYSRATISSGSTAWSPWSSTEWVKGALAGPVNVDTYRIPGAWVIPSRTGVTGLPGTTPGVLEVIVTPSTGVRMQRFTERVADDNVNVWHRYSGAAAGWAGIAWGLLNKPIPEPGAGGSSRTADVQVSDHATRVEIAASRRGGSIGTSGVPVFMWRFDHWLLTFRDKIFPILREFNLPATLNVNYDNMGLEQNGAGSITWEHVQDWNQYDGIEIANHGSTHTNPTTMEAIFHEVVEGRRNLEAAMPRVAVETWHEHGSAYLIAGDLDGDSGLDLGRAVESFTESYAGRLVMAEHAVVEGKFGSFYPPLTGRPQVGQSHYSLDRDTATTAITAIEFAQKVGRGMTGYTHPGLMDQVNIGGSLYPATYNEDGSVDLAYDGGQHYATEQALRDWATTEGHIVHMPVKDFRAICQWLATERDAGRLMVMTAAGGGFADKAGNQRENLLVSPDLSADWSYTAGWSISGKGSALVATSGESSAPLSQSMLLHTRFGWAMGAAHELLVWAKASAATSLTLSMEQLGNPGNWKAETVHQVPGDSVLRPYRLNLTLPRDTTISQMRVSLGGPNLTIQGEPLLAAI